MHMRSQVIISFILIHAFIRLSAGLHEATQLLQLSKLAASIVSKAVSKQPGQAKPAASDVRLRTLLALLNRAGRGGRGTEESLRRVQPLFLELLDMWEAAMAAEAAKAAEEAETFKTKVRETSFKSEEVLPSDQQPRLPVKPRP